MNRLLIICTVLALSFLTLGQGQLTFCDTCDVMVNRLCVLCLPRSLVTRNCFCGISDPLSIECLAASPCEGVGK
ncbi:hypothetical protein Btru_000411 [Bulinus truncatus]|nr:hypothetical protein Btru_000411 [Bulinus truncatus]